MIMSEYLLFLQGFLKDPKRVGNILPSSQLLANKIVQSVQWHNVNAVAELGAGTGAITHLMTSQLTNSTKVLLFERNKKMREHLKAIYPECIFHSNASYLLKKLNQEGIRELDCIICGLPFFNFSIEMRDKILHQIVKSLKPGGILVAYQHSLHMKKRWAKQLLIEKIEFVPYTFPPTFVYICRKKE
ncbi:phospholipid methyltransferase [Paenibacillus odorifer]|uniref:Phospholipid methyltransferase n=2 Tax=Paenibacillus TaxID=44249 RepID=A0ABX3GK84_9BACL|nr:phospholipid N-methyltransferase [Paenibacillus sp. PastH-4]MDH6447132.1 phospholipid N-methyltransferase [Paenibacillus sp. PastF-4]MDH6531280.1 phospholipid N-methyltransferase [Paenibacillus sp. PastH-3]OMC68090.1 phospholipid methyltransferase [Paenibacillus odorifer]OMC75937.1 phospholipid methyltransferase [Paenibacillus odorifer]